MADTQAQLVTRSPDGSLLILAWYLDDDQAAGLRELLGDPDHESLVPPGTARAVQETGRRGAIMIREPEDGRG